MNKGVLFFVLVGLVFVSFNTHYVLAQGATVCCAETQSGAFCQDVPSEECAPGSQQAPTACASTSFCRSGTCFDSDEGTCLDNVPELVCNDNGGVWSLDSPAQCSLGCCTLGDQAAFVTQTRCIALSGQLGLQTNYNPSIQDELACITSVSGQEKGACVYEQNFQRTCEFTTRMNCDDNIGSDQGTEFYAGSLCSNPDLGTNCGKTRETILLDGKDEIYWMDTCGNAANIYDASKVDDDTYWSVIFDKEESCNPNSQNGNAGSASCGNCNYLLGSFGRDKSVAGGNPSYGDYICADLNCGTTSDGSSRKHGESWCVSNDAGGIDDGTNSVGSGAYRHICINGEEVVEYCGDFRNKVCLEDQEEGFSQGACVVNRWQECAEQVEQDDCENTDRRDCQWIPGERLNLEGNQGASGACVPKNAPGLNFWSESSDAVGVCSLASVSCTVTYEKDLFGDTKCVDNCECLEDSWEQQRGEVCAALGDCGPGINWAGKSGTEKGFKITIEKQ